LKKAKEAYQCLYAENCFLKTNQKQMNVAINAIRIELQETKKTCDFLQKENLALNNTQKKVSKEFYQEEDSDLISRDELEFLKKAFSNLEKDYDSLDKERKKLDMAFKKLSRRFKEYVCCFFLISVPGVMIFMRLGAHTFFQDQEYCSM
jgi:chromosome segregation ATPase